MHWTKFIHQKQIPTRLTVELTPASVRSKSLFSFFMRNKEVDKWTEIKDELLKREGARCWICETESNHLHLHEFWIYNDQTHQASLKEIHHLCDLCDKIKRSDLWFFTDFGKVQLKELGINDDDLIIHYCKVNNCSREEFSKNWEEAVILWHKRNVIHWKQDFGNYNVE